MESKLEDIAQLTGEIDYSDAMSISRKAASDTEYRKKVRELIGDWEDAQEAGDDAAATKAAKAIKALSPENMKDGGNDKFPFTVSFNQDDLKDDRGVNSRYPQGTVSRILLLRCEEQNTELWMKIYFIPNGGKEFIFGSKLNNITDSLKGYVSQQDFNGFAPKVCFNPTEINLIYNAIEWLEKNKEQVYPKTHL